MKKHPQNSDFLPQEAPGLWEQQAEEQHTREHWNRFYETWRFRQWNKL